MSWGTGSWGAGAPWGTGSAAPPPTLTAVVSDPGPVAPSTNPAVVAIKGGTVCRLIGTNFSDPMTIEIGLGSGGSFVAVAEGFVFDPELDLRRNRVFFGAPRLERGLYSVRVTTVGGVSGVLEDAIAARLFADEYKTVSARSKFARKWLSGTRILKG